MYIEKSFIGLNINSANNMKLNWFYSYKIVK